jgi:hypothetical protein
LPYEEDGRQACPYLTRQHFRRKEESAGPFGIDGSIALYFYLFLTTRRFASATSRLCPDRSCALLSWMGRCLPIGSAVAAQDRI